MRHKSTSSARNRFTRPHFEPDLPDLLALNFHFLSKNKLTLVPSGNIDAQHFDSHVDLPPKVEVLQPED